MHKTHPDYGVHYGDLVRATLDSDIYFGNYERGSQLTEFLQKIFNHGVEEVYFDINDDEADFSDTLFFKVNEKTDIKGIMVIMVNLRPTGFSEVTPNHFGVWFD